MTGSLWAPRALGLLSLALLLAVPAAAPATEDTNQLDDREMAEVTDVVVVTASMYEQELTEAPAAVTVITANDLESIPASDYGDVLQNVPGVNIAQTSARDVNVVARGASNTLATSQLVLLDGRTLYLDFFGFVMWDFLPINPREIKQIEVVRGPGSAVWGANAMTGVVNLITKTPREMAGTSITLGGGEVGTLFGGITYANAGDKSAFKISASYYEQDAYDRPTGFIQGTQNPPLNPLGTPYPQFQNSGTEQPKLDIRFDYDSSESSTWSFSGGYAGTDGIMHTGIGPFDIDSGTTMSYFKVDWTKLAQRFTFFTNILDGDATNLLTIDPTTLMPVAFDFASDTYDFSYNDTRILGEKHILTYGGRFRQNEFDLSIAPAADERQEYGVFLQDEILFSDKVRWLIGGRWDDIDPIGSVFSPRTSLLISPTSEQTFRISYNRAFRAPSMINNFLDLFIIGQVITLPSPPFPPGVPPFPLVNRVIGNPLLTEEQMDAYEIGWVGDFGQALVSVAIYRNEVTDSIDFFTAANYSAANPPPGWPLPPQFVPPNTFPAVLSYRNIGEVVEQGFEFALQYRFSQALRMFLNYSWQDDPEVTGIDQVPYPPPNGPLIDGVNVAPESRFNFGLGYDGGQFFANGNVNYWDEAFWTDVLSSSFWGFTDAFTVVNLGTGVRFGDGKYTLSVSATNVLDEDVQQHVFGDILSRKVMGTLHLNFN